MCDAEGVWTPLAICRDGAVVGFAGLDPSAGSPWIGGVVVDREHPRKGVGRAALERLIATAPCHPGG
jgi:GNAT superfamily N-acetyltransferase